MNIKVHVNKNRLFVHIANWEYLKLSMNSILLNVNQERNYAKNARKPSEKNHMMNII